MSNIGPAELDDRRSSLFVLDVRPAAEYRAGHIEGSYNAPVYADLQRDEVDSLEEHLSAIPADADVVTVCKAGVVARRATTYLEARGFDARTLTGGYLGWRQYDRNTLVYRILSSLRRVTS